ncbi:hypothetical protein MMC12_005549 [Toensbergia leucococca]|nr:hypothetical protein [Toensbergia leucococca]
MKDSTITTGGRGKALTLHTCPIHLTTPLERVEAATALLSEAFADDPTIVYLLSLPTKAHQLAYTPTYFHTLLTAAALNNASIDEVDDWKSCGIMMPPDSSITNPLTLIPAGFPSVIWTLGLGGLQVTRQFLHLPPPRFFLLDYRLT